MLRERAYIFVEDVYIHSFKKSLETLEHVRFFCKAETYIVTYDEKKVEKK